MFLGDNSPELCVLVNAIVLDLCKITEPRKKQLNVKILHALKPFLKEFLNFIFLPK